MARILNIMFGKKRGGLEQASADYHEALLLKGGHEVLSILADDAWVEQTFLNISADVITLKNLGEWDPIATYKLSVIARNFGAEVALCHGNRAIGLGLKALKKICPVVAVAHNYKAKRFPKCDAVFCVSEDLVQALLQLGIAEERLFHMPNMVRIKSQTHRARTFSKPPVIGAMGRFDEGKGFDIYIKALGLIHKNKIAFKAKLGGDGDLSESYQALATAEEMDKNSFELLGWVEDTDSFFDSIDVFVLPSRHESFGLALVEAMAAGLPCITADAEGPLTIVTDNHDALVVKKDNAPAMAERLTQLLANPELAKKLAKNGFETVLKNYDISSAGKKLEKIITQVIARSKA